MSKRSVWVDDDLWDRICDQALRHRNSQAAEVRKALEVYVALSEQDSPVIAEVLDEALDGALE